MLALEEQMFLQDCTIVTLCDSLTNLCAEFLRCAPSEAPAIFDKLIQIASRELEQLQRDTPHIVTADRKTEIIGMLREAIEEARKQVGEFRRIH